MKEVNKNSDTQQQIPKTQKNNPVSFSHIQAS